MGQGYGVSSTAIVGIDTLFFKVRGKEDRHGRLDLDAVDLRHDCRPPITECPREALSPL